MIYEPLEDPMVRSLQAIAAGKSTLTGRERDVVRDALCELARLRSELHAMEFARECWEVAAEGRADLLAEYDPRWRHQTTPGRVTLTIKD